MFAFTFFKFRCPVCRGIYSATDTILGSFWCSECWSQRSPGVYKRCPSCLALLPEPYVCYECDMDDFERDGCDQNEAGESHRDQFLQE